MRIKFFALYLAIVAIVGSIVLYPGKVMSVVRSADFLYYVLIAVGTVMVYGSNMILKQFKKDEDIRVVIGMKMAGLGIAILGMLFVMDII